MLATYKTIALATISSVLVWEQDNHYSREKGTLLGAGTAAKRKLGTVCGRVTSGAPTITAKGTNVGDGTLGSLTTSTGVQIGTYDVTFKTLTVFGVTDPFGRVLADGEVGVAYSDSGIAFTVTQGANDDFAVGDGFTVKIVSGGEAFGLLDLGASNGLQTAAAVLLTDADIPANTSVETVFLVRDAVIKAEHLIWPAGITPAQIATALASLKAAGIVVTKEV